MIKIEQKYRATYTGEEVTVSMKQEGLETSYEKEWIPNNVFNNHLTTQAVVIGGGWSRTNLDLNLIKNHKGGLFGADKLQTYGTNDVYKEIDVDFLVVVGRENAKAVSKSGYCKDHVVYTNAGNAMDYPNKFYLIPQDPNWNAGAIAAYMACFDGHKKVYLLGFDMDETRAFWTKAMKLVFDTYNEVDFVFVNVTDDAYMPNEWKDTLNLRAISMRDFVLEADIG